MKLVGIIDEDFVNYKKISMTLEFPYCTFKCCKENGNAICQNSDLANATIRNFENQSLIDSYLHNPLSQAIVMQGLEPFDSFDEIYEFIKMFRDQCKDDIVIYSGYTEDEIRDKVTKLKSFKNIIIKFGRYIPDQEYHHDDILGVNLVSSNQYAKRIEDL